MESPSTARLEAAAGRAPPISLDGKLRIARRGALLVLAALLYVPLHYLWRLFRLPSPWPRLFLAQAAWCAGATVTSAGVPLQRDVVFLSNHVSWIDIPAIAGRSGSAFVAKAEIREAPVVGWLSTLNRTVFVARDDRLGVAEQINRVRDALAETWAITIFPEGTTDDGRSLLPFKSPLLRILEPAPPGVMVQPILLDYDAAGPDIAWLGEERGKDNALRVLARPGRIALCIHFLEPFDPAAIGGRKAIALEARRRIEAAFATVLGHAPPSFVGHQAWAEGRVRCDSLGGVEALKAAE